MAFRNPVTALPLSAMTGQLTGSQIADGAVTAPKLGAGAVTAPAIGPLAVTDLALAAAAVTAAKIAAGAVTAPAIGPLAVTDLALAAAAVTAAKIAAGAVTAPAIGPLAVSGPAIAAGAVTAAKITAGTITTNEIAAGTIAAGNIAAGTITGAQIAALTIAAGNIAAGAVTAAKITAATITSNEIAANTIVAGNIAANAITAATIAAGAIDGKTITGALIRTAAAGNRWELKSAGFNTLQAYSGIAAETLPGGLTVSSADGSLNLFTPNLGFGQVGVAVFPALSAVGRSRLSLSGMDGAIGPFIWNGDLSALTVNNEGWKAAALVNGWVNYGGAFGPAQYRAMADGSTMLRGMVKSGVGTIFTLPGGYTPPFQEIFLVQSTTGTARIDINANGVVNITYQTGGSNAFVSLAGIRFSCTG
jgi:hypothetical protein